MFCETRTATSKRGAGLCWDRTWCTMLPDTAHQPAVAFRSGYNPPPHPCTAFCTRPSDGHMPLPHCPRLAELLDVQRIGPQHQAGSDSLLTSLAFIKLATKYFQVGPCSLGVWA